MHSLLKRQLKSHLGPAADIPESWRALIEAVDEAYRQSDDDREMLERSLELSSQELLQANASLRALLGKLEARVQERTAELDEANHWLLEEVAERKMVEQRLRESEERLQESAAQTGETLRMTRHVLDGILASMPSAIIGLDSRGMVTHWNKSAARLTNRSAEEAMGKPLVEAFGWLATHIDQVARVIQEGKGYCAQRQPFASGDRTCILDVMIYPLTEHGVEGAVIRLDDVTERAHLEEIMVQTEKMMTVGGLAAGMAHEINNPLGGILQSAQVIMGRLTTDSPVNRRAAGEAGCSLEGIRIFLEHREIVSLLEGVRESAARATQIVSHMLEFSRKSESKRQPCDPRKLLDRAVALSAHDYDLKKFYDFRKISIVREYDPDLPHIPCTATQIEQVLVNLLRNAAQILTMTLSSTDAPPRPPRIVLRASLEAEAVRLEVEDNGPGMSEDVRRRIFEPFFTTKPPGQGTGLGLSVSYFIVTRNHGGTIEVESEPGKGTRFIIRLPLERGREGE